MYVLILLHGNTYIKLNLVLTKCNDISWFSIKTKIHKLLTIIICNFMSCSIFQKKGKEE